MVNLNFQIPGTETLIASTPNPQQPKAAALIAKPVKQPWFFRLATAGAIAVLTSIAIDFIGFAKPAAGQTAASLAYHLQQTGAKMYNASWCPFCRRQAQVFGAAFSQVPYIECFPNGRNGAVNSQCEKAGIGSFPTWVIGGRTYSGMMSIQQLANISNYGTPSNTNDPVKICDYKADLIFYERYPQMLGRKISSSQSSLANEWRGIRRNIRGCQ
jgi:thiol-disulfide isomerase/thioredoxin